MAGLECVRTVAGMASTSTLDPATHNWSSSQEMMLPGLPGWAITISPSARDSKTGSERGRESDAGVDDADEEDNLSLSGC